MQIAGVPTVPLTQRLTAIRAVSEDGPFGASSLVNFLQLTSNLALAAAREKRHHACCLPWRSGCLEPWAFVHVEHEDASYYLRALAKSRSQPTTVVAACIGRRSRCEPSGLR